MLSEKESKKFKGFMDLVKRNVPDMSRIIDIMPLHQKLIDKKNEMNNELNNSSMTQSQKTTYENYAEKEPFISNFYNKKGIFLKTIYSIWK